MGKRMCTTEGCSQRTTARGLCHRHYQAWHRAGGVTTKVAPLEERFWARVRRSGPLECWEWTGAHAPQGYGQIRAYGKTQNAHRIAWEIVRGEIPDGLQIDHLCRNRGCVNPAHLEPVTQRENILRGESPAANWARLRRDAYTIIT